MSGLGNSGIALQYGAGQPGANDPEPTAWETISLEPIPLDRNFLI